MHKVQVCIVRDSRVCQQQDVAPVGKLLCSGQVQYLLCCCSWGGLKARAQLGV